MSQYLQILTALIAYGVAHPDLLNKLWAKLLAAWHASQDLVSEVNDQFHGAIADEPQPRDTVPDEVLDAEDRLEKQLIECGVPAPRGPFKGNFAKILGQLLQSPIGRTLLAQLLSKIGGLGS
jgi:hypothetical protein